MKKFEIQKVVEIIPSVPFDFDSTFHKPDHFTTGDNYWEKGIRWQTWNWEGKCLGLKFNNLGTRQIPKIEVSIYSDEKLDKDFMNSLIEEIKYRYNLDLDLTPFYNVLSGYPPRYQRGAAKLFDD